jgi:hypothetical protein
VGVSEAARRKTDGSAEHQFHLRIICLIINIMLNSCTEHSYAGKKTKWLGCYGKLKTVAVWES